MPFQNGGRQLLDTIRSIFQDNRLPTSPVLHALLFRICSKHLPDLRNCLREQLWQLRAAKLRYQLASVEHRSKASLVAAARDLLLEPSRRQKQRQLIACAATLQALDAYHRSRRTVVERRKFDLPPLDQMIGAPARTVFLPPPEQPVQRQIHQPLVRGIDDYKNDLRSYLELWWYLVPLENRPVSPLYLQMDAEVSAVLAQRLERPQELTIGLASPFANLDFSIHSDPERLHHRDGTPYRFVGLATDPEQMRASRAALARIAASCKTHRVDILCFPELTLDTDSLRELAHLLAADNCDDQPVLVIAGSFHLPGDHGWMNRCTVLDGCGRKLFEQNKSVAFRIPPQRAQALGAAGRALLGIDERGGYEDIDVGTELVIVDSPLGRMVTPICLDFCGDELIDLVTASCVNFFLVPAMTERMKNFHQQAVHLGTRTGAASFVANSVWLLKRLAKSDAAIDNELSVMGYLPRRGGLFTRAQRAADCEDLRLFTMRVLLGMTG